MDDDIITHTCPTILFSRQLLTQNDLKYTIFLHFSGLNSQIHIF